MVNIVTPDTTPEHRPVYNSDDVFSPYGAQDPDAWMNDFAEIDFDNTNDIALLLDADEATVVTVSLSDDDEDYEIEDDADAGYDSDFATPPHSPINLSVLPSSPPRLVRTSAPRFYVDFFETNVPITPLDLETHFNQ